MADLAVEYLPPSALKDLLQKNQNAYRSGSIFADSGYAANHAYGEFSHWHDFLNQYQQTLIERCPDPGATENCAKVWAHFFGTVAHALSDNNFDRYFVPQVAAHDFNVNAVLKLLLFRRSESSLFFSPSLIRTDHFLSSSAV